jgi:hypothetical protein
MCALAWKMVKVCKYVDCRSEGGGDIESLFWQILKLVKHRSNLRPLSYALAKQVYPALAKNFDDVAL